ncbi:TPA: alpha/beta hydrolase [Burkholderia cenocepacia]|uniref:Alpha/beta hydrolase n=1 Tax=Burkholderia latens TaxID=488446 RepID=A0A6H9T5S7_9BURK|nr:MULTISPECIES: alpha/beta hydrolase [Burkholderia]KAB0644680.1 alpha/beta hydrolase [Burkholderia latens]MBJ9922835.1 alpha/beta hydrolase [Burkholderia cenocepacia]UJH78830.1 alpha/beta hydrolase [Burkholderia cenocepacia]VWB22682.1 esterase/lipase [Burkholderia latens]HDR9879845.1 alpha/beta hydrolase [Burkholderia cenocepacia]
MIPDTMNLSAGMRAFIDTASSFASERDDWPSRRAAFARQCAHFTPPAPDGVTAVDRTLGGVRTRCILPHGPAPVNGWPVLVFFHGGGWTAGDHTTHDWFAYALLARIDVAVLMIDYRLAPDACFPAPIVDGLTVWDAMSSAGLPLDPTRRAVGGDSAGGTLAAALCIALKRRGAAQPAAQLLLYPVLSARTEFGSIRENAHAPMLTARGLADSIALYVPREVDRSDALAMPLEGDGGALAPALVAVAQYDPLRDQGLTYAQRLAAAGGESVAWHGDGLVHACLRAPWLPEVDAMYARSAAFLLERGLAVARGCVDERAR